MQRFLAVLLLVPLSTAARGEFSVVEANIAPWTQAALGQALTPQQYLSSPQAQDAVFKHRFGQYVDQFGEEGAARAWFGGPGNVNKTDLTDRHKRLSIGDYGKTYMGVNRSTFVIGGDGNVAKVFRNVQPAEHADQVLEALSR